MKKLRTNAAWFMERYGAQVTLFVLSTIFILPALWMFLTAFKTNEEALRTPPVWIPTQWHFENFWKAFAYDSDKLGFIPFAVYGRNSLLLCALVVVGTTLSNAVVAYAFARLRWPGRDIFFRITISTMMVPFPVLMVPLYALFRDMHWLGTYRPLWVPAWFAGAFNIFLLRQFFRSIPFELSEAAKIDGGSEWLIFWRVVMPLCKPALVVVALFSFLGTWRDFLGPLLYLQDQQLYTLPLGLQSFQGSQSGSGQWDLLMAASTIVIAPVVLIYFFLQRFFIEGITLTGIKG